jgi:DNA-binding transcriptional regulator YiaG
VAEAREAEEKRLREAKATAASRLFEELNEDEKVRVDDGLALLGTLKDARPVMDALLRRFGMFAENPVRFPARELRLLLECEGPHGHERVWAALRALQRIEYGYEAVSVGRDLAGKAVGPLVADVVYEAKGKGSHTDGDFYITLSELALGCLRAFKVAGPRIQDARNIFRFDWAAKLEKEAREGLDFVQGFSALAPYFDRAKGFTPHQTRLRTWLENNLTLRKDAASKGRESHRVPYTAADAGEPRVYTASFCPLLEKGHNYYAALGHYQKNAETGRKLKGRPQAETATGGAKTGGLLEVLGYELPPGRADAGRTKVAEAALKDLRAVVEEALGGRVVGRRNGQWMTLSEADRVRAEELLEDVSWFLFVADDFRERMHHTIEAHHENRRQRGETDHAVRVITHRPTYEKALEDRGEAAKGGGLAELRERLYAARKERRLSQADVGRVFGVSQSIVASWERGTERKGKAIPENIRAIVLRWIEKGEGPTEDELKALSARRRGSRKAAS